jgi:transcriptional regulator with XRE-family HTH domain
MTYVHKQCDTLAVNPAERVRDALTRWLDTTKLTQRQLAKGLDRSQPWLDKVLQGKNDVRLADLDVVANTLRTTASELVRAEDDRYQMELSPTELRVIERLRHRPELMEAIAILLDVRPPKVEPVFPKLKKKHSVGV